MCEEGIVGKKWRVRYPLYSFLNPPYKNKHNFTRFMNESQLYEEIQNFIPVQNG